MVNCHFIVSVIFTSIVTIVLKLKIGLDDQKKIDQTHLPITQNHFLRNF